MSYKSRQQSDNIARDAFYQSDMDHSGTITIYQFYPFLQAVFQRLGIYRQVNQPECQQLFRFYDDDRNGFLTPNQLVDIVWDLYTADIQNDRVAIQQMLQKIVIQKYYNRNYNQFNTSNLYGHWGQTNNKGDWRNYRFNPYQMQKMQKFGYQFNRPHNNFQTMGMSNNQQGFNQQQNFNQGGFGQQQNFNQGGFNQGGFNQQQNFNQGGFGQKKQSSLGNFGQGSYGANNGSFGNGAMQMGDGMTGGQGVINLSGNTNMNMGNGYQQGNMGMMQQMGSNMMNVGNTMMNVGSNIMNVGSNMMGMGNNGMGRMGMGNQMGNNGMGMGMGNGMGNNMGMGMGNNNMNQGMQGGWGQGNQRNFHMVNPNAQWGQQQLQMDPFGWNQIPTYGNDPQHIVLPSPSQLSQNQKMIELNGFGQMTQYLQWQQISLVTPIRSRQLTQQQCYEAVKQLPYLLQQKGYNGQIHFKIYFSEFINLLEQNKFQW